MRIGRPPVRRRNSGQKLQAARVEAARRNAKWTELDESDLVARGDLFVSVATDAVFAPARGVIFEPHTASPIADFAPLRFFVHDDQLVFLEAQPGTWSDEIARQERRRAS